MAKHIMIDIEGLDTSPSTTILTIAAQSFDPFGQGYLTTNFYARVTLESQTDRTINEDTINWWAQLPIEAQNEAFGEDNRIPLDKALAELHKLCWNADFIWMNGPTYDATILEHAYRSYKMPLPWQYYKIRDTRTVYGLWPDCPKPPTSHHALEDCKRQIDILQSTLAHLNITKMR
jgi:hypothetical protein